MTPNQRRVLEAAGIEVRQGPGSIFGLPVRIIDGPDPDTVFVMDARPIRLERPSLLDPNDIAWKVRFGAGATGEGDQG